MKCTKLFLTPNTLIHIQWRRAATNEWWLMRLHSKASLSRASEKDIQWFLHLQRWRSFPLNSSHFTHVRSSTETLESRQEVQNYLAFGWNMECNTPFICKATLKWFYCQNGKSLRVTNLTKIHAFADSRDWWGLIAKCHRRNENALTPTLWGFLDTLWEVDIAITSR